MPDKFSACGSSFYSVYKNSFYTLLASSLYNLSGYFFVRIVFAFDQDE